MPFNPGQLNWAALSGLASGNTVGEQFGNMNSIMAAQQPLIAQQQQENKTLAYLAQYHPDIAAQVKAGMPMANAMTMVAQAQKPVTPDFKTVGDALYNTQTGEWIQPPAEMRQPDDVKRGLTPVWGMKNGKRVLGTIGEDGSFLETTLPEGFEPTPGTSTVDLGTSIGVRDNKTGDIIRTVPKDVSGVEQQKAEGKIIGDAKGILPAVKSTATVMKDMIAKVKNDPYRERGTGLSSVFNAVPATGGYDFQKKVDQLGGQTFLKAIEQMQGFGALSNQEGQTAKDAIARLDTAQSEEAFNEALTDLEAIIDSGVVRAEQMARQQPTSTQPTKTDTGVVDYQDFFK